MLVALFSERSFAVGSAFTKSETVQVAAFSALILNEPVPLIGWVAILLGTLGVVILSQRPGGRGGLWNRGAALGLAGARRRRCDRRRAGERHRAAARQQRRQHRQRRRYRQHHQWSSRRC